MNGWATRESPWSNAGSALDAETDVPSWRRPPAELRSYTADRPLPADTPSGEVHPFAPASPASAPPSAAEGSRPDNSAAPRWSDSRSRYQDLLAHLSPNGSEPRQNEPPRAAEPPRTAPVRPDPLSPDLLGPDAQDTTELRAVNGILPASAPPYPYEGDLDDARRDAPRPPAGQQRAAVPAERPFPAVRPATPGGRRADWSTSDSARHALDAPMESLSRVPQPSVADESRSGDQGPIRSSYDPSSFPRRLRSEPADGPARYAQSGAFPGHSAGDPGPGGTPERSSPALPQRVPAQPDVPTVPEPPSAEPTAETPALARIATHLRRGDVLSAQERQEGFDVNAILEAVREVDGVRDASLRSTPAGAHSLRLDLSEGADPAEVSRQVARLLQDRMGLDAAMQGATPLAAAQVPAAAPRSAPPAPLAPAPRSAPPSYSSPAAPASAPPAAQPARTPPPPAARTSALPAARTSAPPAAPASAPPARVVAPNAPVTPFVPSQPNPAGRPVPPSPGFASGPTAGFMAPVPTGVEPAPPRPLDPGEQPGPRVMIENVRVNTFGTEATVEVRLIVNGLVTSGEATGPAVDGYLLRLCAMATASAVDELLTHSDHADGPAKCFVEHAASVPFGSTQVAVVVLLLSVGGWVEQLSGSAVITGDDRQAMVRATLAAINRRLEALLS
ncbi:Daple [Actinoplanes sp. NPDC049118]|uniref:Daple n=1 Tax=Actinoplanes sp. NPDC049118 TaxID=3155769 RepID=UPI0033F97EED